MTLNPIDSALAIAVGEFDYAEVERLVLVENANVDSADRYGRTQLMCAVMPDELGDHNSLMAIRKIVVLLLELEADPRLVDQFGMKAVDYAKQFGDPNWKDNFGYPATGILTDDRREILNNICQLLE